jgi:hypothetical protein
MKKAHDNLEDELVYNMHEQSWYSSCDGIDDNDDLLIYRFWHRMSARWRLVK